MIRNSLKIGQYLGIEKANLSGASSALHSSDMRLLKLINNTVDILLLELKILHCEVVPFQIEHLGIINEFYHLLREALKFIMRVLGEFQDFINKMPDESLDVVGMVTDTFIIADDMVGTIYDLRISV